jgi:uncharacterized membrane protein YidH (DUF202 family)
MSSSVKDENPGMGDLGDRADPPASDATAGAAAPVSNEDNCFICMDSAPPLLVGKICDCSSLAVHRTCLEDWINHSAHAHAELSQRMVCAICKVQYRLPYEVMTSEVPPSKPRNKAVCTTLMVLWLAVGAALAGLCYWLQVRETVTSLSYRAVMAILCIYAVASILMYVYLLSKVELAMDERKAAERPRISFVHVDEVDAAAPAAAAPAAEHALAAERAVGGGSSTRDANGPATIGSAFAAEDDSPV